MRLWIAAGLVSALMTTQTAQADVTTEHQLWLDATVRAEVVDELKVSFTQHVRTADNAHRVNQVIPELGVSYGFLDYFSIGAGGRYSLEKNDDGESERSVRLHGQMGIESPDLGPVELGYRLRFQRETAPNDDEAKVRLRNKVGIQLDTDSAVKPGVFYEHFLDPGGERGHKAQKYRLGAGLGLKIDKHHRLKFKFFQDKEIDGDGDKERIASIGYRYNF